MDLGIADKVALVLAGGGGLGGAIAEALASEGASVGVADIDENAALGTVQRVTKLGGTARSFACDLGQSSAIDQLADEVGRTLGAPDILVNITGGPPPSSAVGVAADTWARQFESMVLSVMRITELVLPHMRSAGWGRVVTSTSSGVLSPIPNLAVSNALRLSLVGWSKTLSCEVAREGVTVNVVVPGRIATGRVEHLDQARAAREKRSVEQVAEESAASIPLGRYGAPKEYAAGVAFLASDQASYITGSVLRIDGGMITSI